MEFKERPKKGVVVKNRIAPDVWIRSLVRVLLVGHVLSDY